MSSPSAGPDVHFGEPLGPQVLDVIFNCPPEVVLHTLVSAN
jgi:hypothetical protein